MKDRILTNTARSVKRAFPRFLSLLVMSMLGVFAFAGLQATAPDMRRTLDRYLDRGCLYDFRIVSDMGLTDEDVGAFASLDGVETAEPGFLRDTVIGTGDGETVLRVFSLPEKINVLTLLRGSFPASENEVVTEENFLRDLGLSLGDRLALGDGFTVTDAVIVGTVDTPLYFNNTDLSQDRGSTTAGTGTVGYYVYAPSEAFDADVYSCIYLTVTGADRELTGSERYLALTDAVRKNLDAIREERQNARYAQILADANEEIDKSEKELNDGLKEAEDELGKAKSELDDALSGLNEAEKTLSEAEEALVSSRKTLNDGWSAFRDTLSGAGMTEDEIAPAAAGLEASIPGLKAALEQLPAGSPQYEALSARYTAAVQTLASLRRLEETASLLQSCEEEYQGKQTELETGKEALAGKRKEYKDRLAAYEKVLAGYESKKTDGLSEIVDARAALAGLKHPTISVFDRTDDATYSDYLDDADSVANLSKIFPVIFFAVAVLVSLISMNRMVEEERGEIGALKSLGFGNGRIMAKYLIFSLSATIVGGALGAALGLTILPTMITGIYGILFDVPGLILGLNPVSTLVGFFITVLCVSGTSVYTAWKELRAGPAELLRPKAPKSGKRVFLEKIGPIWERMRFSEKVTVRNLFRYRKRVIVTVGGIAGCTALMLCGFGLRDAITDIGAEQCGGIYRFDATVYVSSPDEKTEELFSGEGITAFHPTRQIVGTAEGIETTLFIAKDLSSLPEINRLPDNGGGPDLIPAPGTVIVTEKLASMLGLSVGDTVTLTDADNKTCRFPISGIAVNYVGHYLYVDADTAAAEGVTFTPNVYYLKLENGTPHDALSRRLLSDPHVLSVGYKTDLLENINRMLRSLNSVVLILIVLAALLAFTVLYNLSNINVNERKREIATLKVLGFHDREVDAYITKETVILTAIGIALGLGFGYFLTNAVVSTVEIESCRFIHRIKPLSYLLSAVFSALFTLIVNLLTHFKLLSIDMIESLKSVE